MTYLFMHLIQRLIPNGGCCGVIMTIATIFAMTLLFCAVPSSEEQKPPNKRGSLYNSNGVLSLESFTLDFPVMQPGKDVVRNLLIDESMCIKFAYVGPVEIMLLRKNPQTLQIVAYNKTKKPINPDPIYFTVKRCK